MDTLSASGKLLSTCLIAAVVDEDFQDGRLVSARVQRGQIVQGRVHRPVGPVLELPGQVTNFLVFDLTPDDVLKHLWWVGGGEKKKTDLLDRRTELHVQSTITWEPPLG